MTLLKNRSLSFKLMLLFFIAGIAIALVMHFSTGRVLKQFFQDSVRSHLQQYFYYINTEIGSPPDLNKAQKLSDSLNVKIIIRGRDIHWSSDGKFLDRPPIHFRRHLGPPPMHPDSPPMHPEPPRGYESGIHEGRFVIRIKNPHHHTIFITKSDSDLPAPWKLLFNTFLGIFIVLGLLYLLLRWMIKPLKDIQKSIKRIGSGELDHRIAVNRNDEFGELSHEINAMADDVKNMLEAKQQLLLAISHELRSPITRAKVALSLMENNELKVSLESDLGEMEALISDLLEAERLNHRHQVLNLVESDINQLIKDTITKYYPDELIIQTLDSNMATQLLDASRIQFVVKNLIANALKHRKNTRDEITIMTHQDKNTWTLSVEDQGKGIPKQHIPHLTDPFYRVDPSRQRGTGGYGLGLYIIKMIVEAHQGELMIESELDHGTKVSLIF